MKLLVLFLSLFSFVSCNKDDEKKCIGEALVVHTLSGRADKGGIVVDGSLIFCF
jgi:hypothetical protein